MRIVVYVILFCFLSPAQGAWNCSVFPWRRQSTHFASLPNLNFSISIYRPYPDLVRHSVITDTRSKVNSVYMATCFDAAAPLKPHDSFMVAHIYHRMTFVRDHRDSLHGIVNVHVQLKNYTGTIVSCEVDAQRNINNLQVQFADSDGVPTSIAATAEESTLKVGWRQFEYSYLGSLVFIPR